MAVTAQWWGFSKEHGWVIMDREIPGNHPGVRAELMFFRCRDSKVFFLKRENWTSPAYQYAPNFVRAQTGDMATETAAQLDALVARWPEFQVDIRRQHQEIADQQEAESREEAKRAKKEAAELKKQRAATDGLRLVRSPKKEA